MIPTPSGWMRLEHREFIHLRSPAARPVGELRYRELIGPLRPAARVVAERLALPIPTFEATAVGAPERVITGEGEYGALVRVDGRLAGRPIVRPIGMVFGDHVTAILDGFSTVPDYFDELVEIARATTRGIALGLGVRRRRFVYRRPASWQAVAHAMVTHYLPPEHPRDPERIVVYSAIPRGPSHEHVVRWTFEDQIGAVDRVEILEDERVAGQAGLAGRRSRVISHAASGKTRAHLVVVLEDDRYAYPLRLDEGRRPSEAFAALCASVEPLPAPGRAARRATSRRDRLAMLGAFERWTTAGAPNHASTAFEHTTAIARSQRYAELDVYRERETPAAFQPPPGPAVRTRELRMLNAERERYHVIYAAHGETLLHAPHVLRPDDPTPVVCEITAPHHAAQWQHLLAAGLGGALRATDALIFPSAAIERQYVRVFEDWHERFGAPRPRTASIPNAIDPGAHRRDAAARAALRRELGVTDDDVVFASFVRLSAAVDQAGLIALWRALRTSAPRAVLVLAGAPLERAYVDELRTVARHAEVAGRVIVAEHAAADHGAMMSAADVCLQLATAHDEASSADALQAMAHGLPVIAGRWSELAELIRDGEDGLLVDVTSAPVPDALRDAVFGRAPSRLAHDLAGLVRLDHRATLAAIRALVDDDRRHELARRALAAARGRHAIEHATRRRLALFDELAAAAEAAWTGPPPLRPIVDVDVVVRGLASHPLEPGVRVTRADDRALALAPGLEQDAGAEALLARLAGGPQPIAPHEDPGTVARLLAYGVIARAPGAAPLHPAPSPAPDRAPGPGDAARARRDRLAMLGAFVKWPESAPHGTNHAAYAYSVGVARTGRYAAIDVYHHRDPGQRFAPPAELAVTARELAQLADADHYDLVYVAHGEQLGYVPHVLRPRADWAPVVCEVGTTHHPEQWLNLLVASATGAVRATDGVIYASAATRRVHDEIAERWRDHVGAVARPRSTVIVNAIDPATCARELAVREATRAELAIARDDVACLVFGRLSAHTKGDQIAVVALWREVVERAPGAVLILAGAAEDRAHVEHLRRVARQTGVAARVIVVENPYLRWPNARAALMSAADVLVHPSTGLEESSSLVLLEAMAHELPIVASRWSGAGELVRDGEDGMLVDVCAARVPDALRATTFGRTPHLHNGEVSRFAACDGRQLIAAIAGLATNHALRERCAASALRAVHTRHDLAGAMQHRVEFFDELAARARAEWTGRPPPSRPLVDLAALVRALVADHEASP